MNSSMNPQQATGFAETLGGQAAAINTAPAKGIMPGARHIPAPSLTTLLAALAARSNREDATWKVKAQEFMAG